VTIRRCVTLTLAALSLAGCGPSRGVRFEQTSHSTGIPESLGTRGAFRVEASVSLSAPPDGLIADGNTLWTVVRPANGLSELQAIDINETQARGSFELMNPAPTRRVPSIAGLASTPDVMWLLTYDGSAGMQLQRLGTHVEPARSAALSARTSIERPSAELELVHSFSRPVRLIGVTDSAVWLMSYTALGDTLWRCDTSTLRMTRFALPSAAGVAITSERVFVLLRAREPRTISIETRNAAGQVIRTSPPLRLADKPGLFLLSACGNEIVGSGVDRQGSSRIFRVPATGFPVTYSRKPIRGYPEAIVFGEHCQRIWIATVSAVGEGHITRLAASSLTATGQIGNIMPGALLWTNGHLWASDLEHAAILRIG
jgi:hypothetical protein